MPSLSSDINSSLITKQDEQNSSDQGEGLEAKVLMLKKQATTGRKTHVLGSAAVRARDSPAHGSKISIARVSQTVLNPSKGPSKVSIRTNLKKIELNASGEEIKRPKTNKEQLAEFQNFSNLNERDIFMKKKSMQTVESKVTGLKEAIDLFYSR